jgi:RNA polymerase sigma factor (sigma-70 family)
MKDKVAKYYAENLPMLLGLTRLDNPSDAEEVASEAVITVLRQVEAGRLTKVEDIPKFFSTAITSRSIDFMRSADRHGVVDYELESGITFDQQFDESPTPEEILEMQEIDRGVELLIERVVNKNKRDILYKRIVYCKPAREVAKEVGVSIGYVNKVIREFGET